MRSKGHISTEDTTPVARTGSRTMPLKTHGIFFVQSVFCYVFLMVNWDTRKRWRVPKKWLIWALSMVMREWNIHGYDEDETSRNSLLRASQFFQGACFFLGGGLVVRIILSVPGEKKSPGNQMVKWKKNYLKDCWEKNQGVVVEFLKNYIVSSNSWFLLVFFVLFGTMFCWWMVGRV